MVVLGGVAVSYERGTPVARTRPFFLRQTDPCGLKTGTSTPKTCMRVLPREPVRTGFGVGGAGLGALGVWLSDEGPGLRVREAEVPRRAREPEAFRTGVPRS